MWATLFHLVFGNALIGVGEGFAVARFFRLPMTNTAGVMVLANYFSAWAGYMAMCMIMPRLVPELLGDQPLYRASLVLWFVGGVSYFASVVLEMPFCWFCLRKSQRPWTNALLASVMAQTISYGLLVPYYLAASPTSLVTEVDQDASLSFARHEKAWVYFIEPDRGDICRIRPDGTKRELVMVAGVTNQYGRLQLIPSSGESAWNLGLVTVRGSLSEGNSAKILLERFAKRTREIRSPDFIEDSQLNFGKPVDYRTLVESHWEIWLGYWAAEGVRAVKTSTGERRRFALEAPFIMDWFARNATVLPSGLLIYQLGHQIVALDLDHRKVGLVTLGRGPVVVLEE
ncbi:MAG: hypothetical protein WCS99_06120 [Limisphaerales bacterium]